MLSIQKTTASASSESETLEKHIPMLQCKDIAKPIQEGIKPPGYTCIAFNKPICIGCMKNQLKCACGSRICQKPLKKRPMLCENHLYNCEEQFDNIEDLESHQRMCFFRQVFCPEIFCQVASAKVTFNDIFQHLEGIKSNGANHFEQEIERAVDFGLDEFELPLCLAESQCLTYMCPLRFETCTDVFWCVNQKLGHSEYFVVYHHGSPDEAEKFVCQFSVESDEEKYFFQGPVFTLDHSMYDIVSSFPVFSVSSVVMKRMMMESKRLLLKVKRQEL